MTKKRTNVPWMPADACGRSLKGLTINLLVADVDRAQCFQRHVLECDVVYSDPDIAVVRGYGAEWMLHADHTYDDHPHLALTVLLQHLLCAINRRCRKAAAQWFRMLRISEVRTQ